MKTDIRERNEFFSGIAISLPASNCLRELQNDRTQHIPSLQCRKYQDPSTEKRGEWESVHRQMAFNTTHYIYEKLLHYEDSFVSVNYSLSRKVEDLSSRIIFMCSLSKMVLFCSVAKRLLFSSLLLSLYVFPTAIPFFFI